MIFLFRPAVEYAMHTKKRCFDLARSLRGKVVHQVFDGFLLRITRRKDHTIAHVLDTPGDFFVAGFEAMFSTADGDVITNVLNGRMGYYLRSREGEPYAGNMTYALVKTDEVSYANFLESSFNAPSKYLSASGRAAESFYSSRMYSLPSSGAYSAYVVGGADSLELPTSDFYVFRLFPYGATNTSFWNQQQPSEIEPGLLDWRVLHISANDLLGPQSSPYLRDNDLVASVYSNTNVYVVAKREYGYISTPETGFVGWQPEGALLRAGRVDVSVVGEGDEVQTVANIVSLGEFTVSDLFPEDQPQVTSWEKSELADFFTLISINSDHSPFSDDATYVTSPQFSGEIGPSLSFGMVQNIDTTTSGDIDAYNNPRMSCVGLSVGVDFLFTVQSSRRLADMNCTWRYLNTELEPVDVALDYPEVASDAIGDNSLNHTALYLVRFLNDGSKITRCLHRQTYAVHDPQYRDSRRVQYIPVMNTLLTDGETEQSCFFCVRSDSPKYVGSDGFIYNAIAPAANESALVMVFGDGSIVEAQLGSLYPVFYPITKNRVPEPTTDTLDGVSRRVGYGWYSDYQLFVNVARFNKVPVVPVCLYAPDMAAVIAAPQAGYSNASQVAKLVVFRISDGSVVAESEFELPFVVDGYIPEQLTQWNVTCVEQGTVDEEGNLTRYAKLLLSEVVFGNPSVLYRADDLTTLHTIGVWGDIGQTYLRGPVYYIGSALAPVTIGKSTFRSFLTGNPVPDSGT